jgi:NADPH-dependent glutamate synthase beta subunit-like oxidoreductase
MLQGIMVMGGLGVIVGIGLALASKVFYVYVDPLIEAVDEALPGANCGGCGMPGCTSNAEAIVAGKASPASCVAGGSDLAAEIAAILGVEVGAKEPDIARPGCTYGFQDADTKYEYNGIRDCRAAALLSGGVKVCPIGCLGLETCVNACPFDALSMGPDNLPVVNLDRCTGCGTCERVCPKHIITLTSNSRRVQNEYTTEMCTAPCQRSCPAGIDIPLYIRLISERRYLEAVRAIKETNPFPSVCGRICVHPCEYECRRNLVDEPVAINPLKRFATDFERLSGDHVQIFQAPETRKEVAVVGGGAEGLTAAYFLNRLGHKTRVYDADSRLGGLLRTGLPVNRLPEEVLDWDIDGILEAGVEAHTEKRLGQDISVESLLKEGASAVLVTAGGWDTYLALKEGQAMPQSLPGVYFLLDFMLQARAGQSLPDLGHVMILGGGKSSLDAARLCKEGGAKEVTILFRTDKKSGIVDHDILDDAESEGIEIRFETVMTKMLGEGDRLSHVEIVPLTDTGAEGETGPAEVKAVDTLLLGAGRFPELIYCKRSTAEDGQDSIESPPGPVLWETYSPYAGPFAREALGLFRPGEAAGDYKAVVEAIGAGRRSAASLNQYLSGDPVAAPEGMICKGTEVLNVVSLNRVSPALREGMGELPMEEQRTDPSAEIALGYTEEQALRESKRCLQCGLICYRKTEGGVVH